MTDNPRPRKYWNALKTKLQAEGNEVSQNMGQLKAIRQWAIGYWYAIKKSQKK